MSTATQGWDQLHSKKLVKLPLARLIQRCPDEQIIIPDNIRDAITQKEMRQAAIRNVRRRAWHHRTQLQQLEALQTVLEADFNEWCLQVFGAESSKIVRRGRK